MELPIDWPSFKNNWLDPKHSAIANQLRRCPVGDRRTAEQKVLDHAINRTKAWEDAAQRAETRGESALAIFYRNTAWRISTGKEWLADVVIQESK